MLYHSRSLVHLLMPIDNDCVCWVRRMKSTLTLLARMRRPLILRASNSRYGHTILYRLFKTHFTAPEAPSSSFSILQPFTCQSWVTFSGLLVTVLGALYLVWVNNDTGFGDDYLRAVESISSGPEVRNEQQEQQTRVLL